MVLVSTYRVLKFAWQGFWRNIWLSLVSITVIVLTLISVNSLIILNAVTSSAINSIEDKIDVSVYFKSDVKEAQVLEVKTYLDSLSQVENIEYVSQAQALEDFRQKHKDDLAILQSLEELEENPLGATLNVKAKKISDYPDILTVLDNSKYKDWILNKNFDDHREYINRINKVSNNIRQVGIALTAVFTFIAILIIVNTIRVTIYTHRGEIGIMKLVGATNNFIRSPFLLEGVFYGIIACLVAIGITYLILKLIQPYLTSFFIGAEIDIINYFNVNFWQIFGLELLVIILLNILSSSVAIRRYLKV